MMLQEFIKKKSTDILSRLPQQEGDEDLCAVFDSSARDDYPDDFFETFSLLKHFCEERVYFNTEEWVGPYSKNSLPIKEMLLRARNPENQDALFEGIDQFYKFGLSNDIDAIVVAAALTQALEENSFPVTINISPVAAISQSFWNDVAPFMDKVTGSGALIFELLEGDEVTFLSSITDVDVQILKQAKNHWGFGVAIDDHSGLAVDTVRLEKFSEVTDHVKLDGGTVRGDGAEDIGDYVKKAAKRIGDLVPDAGIVVEWVQSFPEARSIFQKNPDLLLFVQGRNLTEENDPRAVKRLQEKPVPVLIKPLVL